MEVSSDARRLGHFPSGLNRVVRAIIEIAIVAFLCALVSTAAWRSIFTLHSGTRADFRSGTSQILLAYLMMLIEWGAPLLGAFLYGWRRQRQLTFVLALIGWMVGLILSGLVMSAVLSALGFSNIQVLHHARAHRHPAPVWLSWMAWIFWYAIFSALPSLAAIQGQKLRLARRQSR